MLTFERGDRAGYEIYQLENLLYLNMLGLISAILRPKTVGQLDDRFQLDETASEYHIGGTQLSDLFGKVQLASARMVGLPSQDHREIGRELTDPLTDN